MPYRVNHIHLKAADPAKTAAWYVEAFDLTIQGDSVRPAPFGDRFVRCQSAGGGMVINISGARSGETLRPGDAQPHYGLEHFGVDSDDLQADIARLAALGAPLLDGPTELGNGVTIAFVKAPDDVRIELIQWPPSAAS